MKRKPETVVKSRMTNDSAFRGRVIHCGIPHRDHEGIPSRQKVLLLEADLFNAGTTFGSGK